MYADDAVYVGKGGFGRAITSAIEHKRIVSAIIWAPTQTEKGAFVAEFMLQTLFKLKKHTSTSLNIRWSPGKKILEALTKI